MEVVGAEAVEVEEEGRLGNRVPHMFWVGGLG